MGKKLKMYHEKEWYGFIETEEIYEGLKSGKTHWTPHLESKLKYIKLPVEVFNRLMELDKQITAIPFTIEATKGEQE